MSEGLPSGWVEVAITKIANIAYGKGLSKNQLYDIGKYPVFGANSIIGYYNEYLYEKPQVLISCRGANSGVINISPPKCYITSNSLIIELPAEYYNCNKFLYYSLYNSDKSTIVTGTAQPQVTIENLVGFSILFPPLNEQKRIVAKLDSIMPRIETVKERLEKVPVIMKRYRQSVLTAAVTGRLTEKWREEHTEVESKVVPLIDIIIGKPRNGYSPTAVKYETPVKSLSLTATTSGTFDSSCFKYIDEDIQNDSYLWLEKDDILIQRSNSINYVGISAIYNGNSYEFIYPDLMMKVKANKELVLPSFLVLSLQSYQTLDYFRSNATGTAGSMPKINQAIVMDTSIYLPPLEEQKEIVKQVDKLFALADKVEAHYNEAKSRVDKLSQSVLAKAFRGELVPQDPNDEPAERLLERIMEEKAKMEAELKAVKKSTKRSKK